MIFFPNWTLPAYVPLNLFRCGNSDLFGGEGVGGENRETKNNNKYYNLIDNNVSN